MREIEFRGISITTNCWEYGYYTQEGGYDIIRRKDSKPGGEGTPIIVKKMTVGQYTGLRDSLGNKIYEGDILKITHPVKELFNGIFEVVINPESMNFNVGIYNLGNGPYKSSEVVGNVHTNPELLLNA